MTAEVPVLERQSIAAQPSLEQRLQRAIWFVTAGLVLSVLGLAALYFAQRYVHPSVSLVDRDLHTVESQVRAAPDDPELRVAAANLYLASGRYAEAEMQAQQVLKAQPAHVGAALAIEGALAGQGRSAEAIDPLAQVVLLNRDNPVAGSSLELAALQQVLGRLYLEQGRAEEAVGALEAAVTINRADADAWLWLGRARAAAGQLDDAAAALGQAVRLVPDFGAAYTEMASVDGQRGDAAGALFAQGMLALESGAYDQATDALQQAARAEPAAAEPHLGLGMVYEKLGRPADAVAEYRQASALDPSSYAARQGVGRLEQRP